MGLECIFACVPDIYCDTTGGPFTYVVVRMLTSAKILAYVHYPVISTVRFGLYADIFHAMLL